MKRRILVCLLLGALTSVGVAYSCWFLTPRSRLAVDVTMMGTTAKRMVRVDAPLGPVEVRSTRRSAIQPWWVNFDLAREQLYVNRRSARGVQIDYFADSDPKWSAWMSISGETWRISDTCATAAGWPSLCVRRVTTGEPWRRKFDWITRDLRIPLPSRWRKATWRDDKATFGFATPTTPIPLGLAANTAFYGGLWALPLIAWPAWRAAAEDARTLHAVCVSGCGAGEVSGVWAAGWGVGERQFDAAVCRA